MARGSWEMSGAAMVGAGFLVMSRLGSFDVGPVHVTAFAAFLALYAGWMSIGYSAGSTSRSTAVNAWFVSKRGRAFALYTLGAGASGGTVVLLGCWQTTTGGGPRRLLRESAYSSCRSRCRCSSETTRGLRLPARRRRTRGTKRARTIDARRPSDHVRTGTRHDDSGR